MAGIHSEIVAFCQRCGGRMQRLPAFGRDRPVCGDCGFVHFATTSNSAAAVVVHERRVLMIRRGISPYRGCWGFPGGFQEHGESLDETAARETLEETGLRVTIERILHVGLTRDDPRKQVNVAVFLARPSCADEVATSVRAADDAREVRFYGWGEMPPIEDIAYESNQRLITELRERFPEGDIR
jgi:ADP-ribose pyrophosphatase YjhB (NUDIX family)